MAIFQKQYNLHLHKSYGFSYSTIKSIENSTPVLEKDQMNPGMAQNWQNVFYKTIAHKNLS